MPLILGITGCIACGKSTIGQISTDLGIPVIDSDKIVHKLYEDDESVKSKVLESFGTLDRKELAKEVFGDDVETQRKRKLLESIVHPAIYRYFCSWVNDHKESKIVANLIPLLFEAGLEDRYDQIITVTANPELQLKRLRERNPELSEQEILNRINSQIPQQEKATRSDYVIDNSGTFEATKEQVIKILENLN